MSDKDKQIKELKSQRDAIFEELHSAGGGSTAKKETKTAAMMPNIYATSSASGFAGTPASGVRTMNKF